MQKMRLRKGVIDQIKKDRALDTDDRVAAILGVTLDEVEAMRQGEAISPTMAAQVAVVQGSGFDLSQWVEYVPSRRTAA
ncbi:MAG: hypothetical protein LKG15_07700 [Corynebacterium provencense]|jgi:plasmid maintenance system antidote protein VapI|uniref:hypothetical protein n=1 Tax=Corynebacterium provencense TaxID=1737425 RepID=UPI002989B532|nr:hypothetical protein [Corynebacterium provencense]